MKKLFTIFLVITIMSSYCTVANAITVGAEGLVTDSAYWKNLNFDKANNLLWQVEYGDPGKDFILIHYNRDCYYCQQMVPQIKNIAEQNKIFMYGIDIGNKLESETQYVYSYGNYFPPGETRGFVIAYMYNNRTKKMTAKHSVRDIMTFMQMIVNSGVRPVRTEPYTRSEYTKLKDGYRIDISSVYGFKKEVLCVAAYDENNRLVNLSFPEVNGGKSYSVNVPYSDIDYVKVLVWQNINNMAPVVDAEIVDIIE